MYFSSFVFPFCCLISFYQEQERHAQYDGAMARIAALETSLSELQSAIQSSTGEGLQQKAEYEAKVACAMVLNALVVGGIFLLSKAIL